MTILPRSGIVSIASWKRLFKWLQAFAEALDSDPVGRTVGDLNQKVSELEKTVRDLKAP